MASPAVTVAMAVKDRRELVERCLDGLLAQSVDGGFEVVALASEAGTVERCRDAGMAWDWQTAIVPRMEAIYRG